LDKVGTFLNEHPVPLPLGMLFTHFPYIQIAHHDVLKLHDKMCCLSKGTAVGQNSLHRGDFILDISKYLHLNNELFVHGCFYLCVL
jgi:hypothetical protein